MHGALFYGMGIGFASGIFIRSFYDLNVAFMAFLLLLSGAFFFASRTLLVGGALIFLSCLSLALSIGMYRLDAAESRTSSLLSLVGKEGAVTGRVVREPEFRETTVHLYVKPTRTNEKVLVTLDRYAPLTFSYGDVVTAKGMITEPISFETDAGRTFPYPGYLRSRGVQVTLPYAEVEIVKHESSLLAALYRGKMRFMETLESVLPEPSAGLGEGILLGVKRALGKDLEDTFRETGIIHIVVLSGYNIMIVVSALMYVLSYFFFPKTRLMIGIVAITLFALLVGPSATVIRASLMAMLLLVAQAIGRIYVVLRALFLVGIAMLVHNPYLLVYDPGFQLSFVATLGLILLSPHTERFLTRIPTRFGLKEVMVATLSTQIFVLPLLLFHTGLLSVVSVVANVLVLPVVPIAMVLTTLTGVFGVFLPPFGYFFGFFAHLSLMYIVRIAEFFGSLPVSSFSFSAFPWWAMVAAYTVLGVVVWKLSKKSAEPTPTSHDPLDVWTFIEEKETLPFR